MDNKTVKLSSLQILISTYDNRPGLERLLKSIIKKYPAANVMIGDSSLQLDRRYYKELRSELAEEGLLNRLIIQHLPYKSSLGQSFNELLKRSSGTYRLLLTDEDVFTDKTDLESMLKVISTHKVGIVGGILNDDKPAAEGKAIDADGVSYHETKRVNRFMMLQRGVTNSLRFDTKSEDPASEFSSQAIKRLPYRLVIVDSAIISNNDIDGETETNETDSDSGGGTTERDLSTDTGGSDTEDGSGDTGASERKDEKSEDTAPRRRQSGG